MCLRVCVCGGGGKGSSVRRALDFSSGGHGTYSHYGRPLPTVLVDVSIMSLAETEVMVSPGMSHHVKISHDSLGNRSRNSIVANDETLRAHDSI